MVLAFPSDALQKLFALGIATKFTFSGHFFEAFQLVLEIVQWITAPSTDESGVQVYGIAPLSIADEVLVRTMANHLNIGMESEATGPLVNLLLKQVVSQLLTQLLTTENIQKLLEEFKKRIGI